MPTQPLRKLIIGVDNNKEPNIFVNITVRNQQLTQFKNHVDKITDKQELSQHKSRHRGRKEVRWQYVIKQLHTPLCSIRMMRLREKIPVPFEQETVDITQVLDVLFGIKAIFGINYVTYLQKDSCVLRFYYQVPVSLRSPSPYIINTEIKYFQLADNIKGLMLLEGYVIVSFDVTSLSTNIFLDLTLKIISDNFQIKR